MKKESKVTDLAVILPWLGVFLFSSPALLVYDMDETFLGLPLVPIYIFTVWGFLILLTGIVARSLPDTRKHTDPAKNVKNSDSSEKISD